MTRVALIAATLLAFYSNATAQTATASLETHCNDIKMVFDAMKFNGDYKNRAYAWLGSGCKGKTPLPVAGDRHNIGWFNTAADILYHGGKISIAPD